MGKIAKSEVGNADNLEKGKKAGRSKREVDREKRDKEKGRREKGDGK